MAKNNPSGCEAGLPAHAEAFTRSGNCRELKETSRNRGPQGITPDLYFIGAPQISMRHEAHKADLIFG